MLNDIRLYIIVSVLFLIMVLFAATSPAGAVPLPCARTQAITIDWSMSSDQTIMSCGPQQISFVNGQAGGKYTLNVRNDGHGGRRGYTITWPANIRWRANRIPPLLTRGRGADVFFFTYDGTQYTSVKVAKTH